MRYMPKSSKPIIGVCGFGFIENIELDLYLRPDDYSEVVCGGTDTIDSLAERWAKKNHLEFIAFLPQYEFYGSYAMLKRNEDIANYVDKLVCFWDGKDKDLKDIIDYCLKINRVQEIHLVEDLDI